MPLTTTRAVGEAAAGQLDRRNKLVTFKNFTSFTGKSSITERTRAAGNTKDVEIVVVLKYLSIF